jgi:hypothetical protein
MPMCFMILEFKVLYFHKFFTRSQTQFGNDFRDAQHILEKSHPFISNPFRCLGVYSIESRNLQGFGNLEGFLRCT